MGIMGDFGLLFCNCSFWWKEILIEGLIMSLCRKIFGSLTALLLPLLPSKTLRIGSVLIYTEEARDRLDDPLATLATAGRC